MTNKKCETWNPSAFLFSELVSEPIWHQTHSIKSIFITELENLLFAGVCVCVWILFSPEILQAGAVKRLTT